MQTDNGQTTAAYMVMAGGVLALVSSFLDWLEFTPEGDPATTFKGTELTAGTAAIGFGIALVVTGAVLLVRGRRTGGRGASIVALVIAGLMLFAGAYSAFAPGDALASFESSAVAEAYGIPQSVAEAAIRSGIEVGDVSVDAQIGAWIGAIAGLIGVLGGIAGLRRSKELRATEPPGVMPAPA